MSVFRSSVALLCILPAAYGAAVQAAAPAPGPAQPTDRNISVDFRRADSAAAAAAQSAPATTASG